VRPPIDGGTILITGASSGIGEALAEQLAPRARTLVLVARRAERLEALAERLERRHEGLSVQVQACDLLDRAAVDDMLEHVSQDAGPVDVLVNNAGFGDMGVFDRSDWDKQQRMIDLNVTALAYLTRRFVPAMIERGRGGILNISSGFGLQFMPGFATYVGTKHFVTGFTESLRTELRSQGVVVTQVCPGPVATEFNDTLGNFTGREPPGFVQLTAEQCARACIRALDRDRALVVPGAAMKVVTWMGSLTPRWLLRWIYGPVGKKMRALQRRD